ncbi:ATP-binding protein [Streptomyces sp. NPDC097619]|uniref:ATP-binding protein n=1 Tax=Streptomyces sp. NPDC097619 TaxID=3157228 RepID=UPI0033310C13
MDTVTAPLGCPATLHIPLPSGPRAAGYARRTVTAMLGLDPALCPPAVAEDLVLIVSELATNAVLHAEAPYALTVGLEPGRAGIAVSDSSGGTRERRPGADGGGGGRRSEPGGRGLRIVRALGADLFLSRTPRGKQVIAIVTW